MNWTSVSSSNLSAVAYNESDQMLYIRFNSGWEYVYYSVPKNIYQGLMNAASHGEYHAAFIKHNYQYKRLI